jgi:DNA-binding MarR family transcriptional regulator
VSVEALTWALDYPAASTTHKVVLLVLANYADADGGCFPGQARIARQTVLSERGVRKALAELEAAGLIRREHRYREGQGGRTSDRIYLALDGNAASGAAISEPRIPAPQRGHTGTSPLTIPAPGAGESLGVEPSEGPSAISSAPEFRPALPPDSDAEALCEQLAARIEVHQSGARPPVTQRWRKDMRLLLDRGPLGQTTPEPKTREAIASTIDIVFRDLTEPQGDNGFCWADQVRSPGALRKHWLKMAQAYRRQHQSSGTRTERAMRRMASRPAAGPLPFPDQQRPPLLALPGA